jgi:hypothetical protein
MVIGYNQIEMAEGDRAKTDFGTEKAIEYKRLPFGLKTVPATFRE